MQTKQLKTKQCPICGEQFEIKTNLNERYCTEGCRMEAAEMRKYPDLVNRIEYRRVCYKCGRIFFSVNRHIVCKKCVSIREKYNHKLYNTKEEKQLFRYRFNRAVQATLLRNRKERYLKKEGLL